MRYAAQTLPSLRIAPWAGAPATPEATLDDHAVLQRLRDGFGHHLAITDLAGEAPRGTLRLGIATPGGATFQASLPMYHGVRSSRAP